jgi:hypothetical protein
MHNDDTMIFLYRFPGLGRTPLRAAHEKTLTHWGWE